MAGTRNTEPGRSASTASSRSGVEAGQVDAPQAELIGV